MRVALLSGVPVAVAVLLIFLSECMGFAWGCGITGAVVVLVGTTVLIGEQLEWFRHAFNRISCRFCAIESGLYKLRGDPREEPQLGERWLEKGEPGFDEILEVIVKRRPDKKHAETSGIRCGSMSGETGGKGTIVHQRIWLRPKGKSLPADLDLLTTREAFEQWIRDARVRSLSSLGFVIVTFGVLLGLVSIIMQAIASGKC